jgi:hypothetical protein
MLKLSNNPTREPATDRAPIVTVPEEYRPASDPRASDQAAWITITVKSLRLSEPLNANLPPKMVDPTVHVLVLQYSGCALLSWGERGVGVARRRGRACHTRSQPSSAAYEPHSLTTLMRSAGQSSSDAAREPPCRPGGSALACRERRITTQCPELAVRGVAHLRASSTPVAMIIAPHAARLRVRPAVAAAARRRARAAARRGVRAAAARRRVRASAGCWCCRHRRSP